MITRSWLAALSRQGVDVPDSLEEPPFTWAKRNGVSEVVLARASAESLSVGFVETLIDYRPAPPFIEQYPIEFARDHVILGLIGEDESIHLALPGLDAWPQLDLARRLFRRPVRPLFAPRDEILRTINQCYEAQSANAGSLLEGISNLPQADDVGTVDDLLASQGRGSAIELVNRILLDAVKAGASDVHFQPYRHKLISRLRIDGVLFDSYDLPKAIQEEVISRIKVIGKMNIAAKRLPQDGRATVNVGDKQIDLRIASLPGSYGERVVLRLLDKSARLYTLSEVGMDAKTNETFGQLISLEHGLILLTGPTGSGKSTTLYAALQTINTKDRNVITLEDPIEYDIEGISQTQINVKKGLTFAMGLRNVLRQDPDIIMVGEIRDQETAVMAIQSALTGHLVFSTLHTNDAANAVTRLLDLGIEPYLVSSSLVAVLAQRLVRKVCPVCRKEATVLPEYCERLGLDPSVFANEKVVRGTGCAKCRQTGYAGRIGISELLLVDEPIRQKIQERATATEIRDVALNNGMRLLRDDGVAKILSGITTAEEVERVTVRTEL